MNEYLVKDLYEAAFLYSRNKVLKRLQKEEGFYWFVFDDRNACERLADDYWSGLASGNIKEFAVSLKTLKERLFASK